MIGRYNEQRLHKCQGKNEFERTGLKTGHYNGKATGELKWS
jgi:hypothetical protein